MFLLFAGFVSTIVVRTVRKGYICETVPNTTKMEVLKCKGEIAFENGYVVLRDLFEYYDRNVNITGSQQTSQNNTPPLEVPFTSKRSTEELPIFPIKLKSYKSFIDCISDSNCGIVSKCYYNLNINEAFRINSTNVNGSIFVIKNYVPFYVDYFWDVYGCVDNPNSDVYHARMAPNSIIYLDSSCVGTHTLRLYVDPNQYVYEDNNNQLYTNTSSLALSPTIDELEPILTVLASNIECARLQTCRYLNNVCFSTSDNIIRCEQYRAGCNYFTDLDETAKEYCLQDCFYLHHPNCIPPNTTLKSEALVQWVCRGGGLEGSSVDGEIHSGPVIALSLLFTTSMVVLIGTCTSLHTYKRKLMVAETAVVNNYL